MHPPRNSLCLAELRSVDSLGNAIVLLCLRSAWHRKRHRFRAPGGLKACREGGGPLEGTPYTLSWGDPGYEKVPRGVPGDGR